MKICIGKWEHEYREWAIRRKWYNEGEGVGGTASVV
jgi:hypothetical protein